ncbi:Riboflavin biosynthesis protein RibBA [Symmachiella dynata]|uniref:GTP cyclohydrolase-2 n=1 Tax=Symmachiella dynata TaxID=2527995 RepID=A0A517ZNW4_9PLAN|nr:GTP cyclohydrolase II [Symmachiella dynata]QDT48570.1 Riboflavin biosynthesis protein RibBA [Symmachiella dynata]QDU44158.1 Riboflavin biosynthesis protein RibBA [Symmachiella dynata]
MPTTHSKNIDDAIAAIQAGRPVIVIDDADRENEGDFICAAESITPETVRLMLRHGMGLLCTPVSAAIAQRLNFSPMVDSRRSSTPMQTPFQIPVDHRSAGTGVSVENRLRTIRAIGDPNSRPDDFFGPGHIHPLVAKEGGVLRRAGHTEAAIDLMHLAGMQPAAALIEICSQETDGMSDHQELKQLSEQFDLPLLTIEELIRYRSEREQLIHREVDAHMPSRYGDLRVIAYRVEHEDQVPIAIVMGDLASVDAPLVRMHSSCFTGDLLASLRCDCGDQLHMALDMIRREGVGAVVYLPQEGRGIGLIPKLKAYVLQDEGYDTVEANHKLGFKADPRDYGIGLQVLKDLDLRRVRLLTNNPKKTDAFAQRFDLEVVEQIPIVASPEKHRQHYLETKRTKMGHILPAAAEIDPVQPASGQEIAEN